MRILFIGTRPKPDNMEYHVIETLKTMGHQVFEFDIKTIFQSSPLVDRYAQYFSRIFLREPERINEQRLKKYIQSVQPDLIIALLGNMISPKTVQLIKKQMDVPFVCWCQDTLATIGRQYIIGSPYDRVFLKDHYMVDLFNNMIGDRFSYLPEACNPKMHFFELPPDSELPMYECDVTTAASLYYYRQQIIEPLANKYHVKVWGDVPDWLDYKLGGSHTGQYIVGQRKRHAFSAAKIALNTLYYAEIDAVNCRFFEIAGCGGFQLVSDKSEVARHLIPGKEVEIFANRSELLEKIDFYLANPEKRKAIAMAGMKRAHDEHTYTHRLESLIAAIN